MQAIIELGSRTLMHNVQHSTSCVLTVGESRRNKHLPLRKSPIYCIKPRVNARFARVDFLSAADQTDDNSPILVPIHIRDQELRFRICKTGTSLLAQHDRSVGQYLSAHRHESDERFG